MYVIFCVISPAKMLLLLLVYLVCTSTSQGIDLGSSSANILKGEPVFCTNSSCNEERRRNGAEMASEKSYSFPYTASSFSFLDEYSNSLENICSYPEENYSEKSLLERNIDELDMLLNDDELANASDALWNAYYSGHQAISGEWQDVYGELLKDVHNRAESSGPSPSFKANLYFLKESLRESSSTGQNTSNESLDNRLKSLIHKLNNIAGSVLGLETIPKSVEDLCSDNSTKATCSQTPKGTDTSASATIKIRTYRAIMGSRNPYTLGRMWTILIAHAGMSTYFSETPVLPFYSWTRLLSGLSEWSAASLNEMCSVEYKRPRFPFRAFRKRFDPNLEIPTTYPRISRLKNSTHKTVCRMLDRLLMSINEEANLHIKILNDVGVPVEFGIPWAQNLQILHSDTCLSNDAGVFDLPCELKNSRLNGEIDRIHSFEFESEQPHILRLRRSQILQAFTAVTGFGAISCRVNYYNATRSAKREGDEPLHIPSQIGETMTKLAAHISLLFSSDSFDDSSKFWLAYETRTKAEALKTLKKRTEEHLRAIGLNDVWSKCIADPSCFSLFPDSRVLMESIFLIPKLNDVITPLLSLYILIPQIFDLGDGAIGTDSFLSHDFGFTGPLLTEIRDKPLTHEELYESGSPYISTYFWIFSFLSQESEYIQSGTAFFREKHPKWVKLLHSHSWFIPKKFRKLYKKVTEGFTRSIKRKNILKAQKLLKSKLPNSFFENILEPFSFVVHSEPLIRLTSFHYLRRDDVNYNGNQTPNYTEYVIQNRSLCENLDAKIKEMATFGLIPEILQAHEGFKGFRHEWKNINLQAMPTPDISIWNERLENVIVQALEKLIKEDSYLLNVKDTVTTLAADSLENLRKARGNVFFFGRSSESLNPKSVPQKVLATLSKPVSTYLYKGEARKDLVWFGVQVDFEKLHDILEKVKSIIIAETNSSVQINVEDAFLKEVQLQIKLLEAKRRRVPPLAARTKAMLGVARNYGEMSEDERRIEFQTSLCIDHCRSLWEMALAYMLPNLLNPKILANYEETFGTQDALKHLNDPNSINNARTILFSDATLNFWQYTTPRPIVEQLKGLKNGQALMYSYLMLFASRVHGSVGNQYLAMTLKQQAPFMAEAIRGWIKKTQKARIIALTSIVSLAFVAIFTVLSTVDIAIRFVDASVVAPTDCIWSPVLQELMCSTVPGATLDFSSAFNMALKQVFHVGVFAGLGSVFFGALTAANVYGIVRAHSNTLRRLETMLGQLVMRFHRLAQNFYSWARASYSRRKALKRVMLERARAQAAVASFSRFEDANDSAEEAMQSFVAASSLSSESEA